MTDTPVAAPATLNERLAGTGLYSQARNFVSHLVNASVDARTGQFTLSITLPGLHANNLAGPLLTPALHFSALGSHASTGFGLGWQFAVSLLDLRNDHLTLGNGEGYRLDRRNSDFSEGGLLAFSDLKIPFLRVRQMDRGGRSYRIEYKTGDCEYLTLQADNTTAIATELVTPEGFRAFMDWQQSNGVSYLLAIRDEQRLLLEARYSAGEILFTRFPGSPQASTFSLLLSNDRLSALVLPVDDSRWTFSYLAVGGLLFVERVVSPLGAVDEVHYDTGSAGHRMPPGAPLEWLPRVSLHRHDPGADQPLVSRSWQWSGTANFLGGDVAPPGGWQDGRDNLYAWPHYAYSCTETLHVADNSPPVTTTLSWNRLHLLTEELVRRGDKVTHRRTVYGEDPNLGWESQPPHCQLPVRVSLCVRDGERCREALTETDYDSHCNVLATRVTYIDEDGTRTRGNSESFTWHAADETGWVRRRHTATLVPGDGLPVAPTLRTTLSYDPLPLRRPGDLQHQVVVREQAEVVGSAGGGLGDTEQRWEVAIASPFFGRPVESRSTLNGLSTTTTWQRLLDAECLRETEATTGYDQTRFSTVTERDLLTGLTCSEWNIDGTETAYRYDALGRVIEQVEAVATPYAIVATCAYLFSDASPRVEETDAAGQVRRLTLDGDGRPVRIEVKDVEVTGTAFREVWSGTYDVEGGLERETHSDWLPGVEAPLVATTRRDREAWGQVGTEYHPDGSVSRTEFDPVAGTSRSWRVGADGVGQGVAQVWRDGRGTVTRAALYWPDGRPLRVENWTLDGLGRPCRHQVLADGLQTESQTRYDAFGRVLTLTRADGSLVTWTYAAHSDGDHPASVALTSPEGVRQLLGSRTYDGQGRLLTEQCGRQVQTLSYRAGQWPHHARRDSAGAITSYEYEPRLGNVVRAVRADGDERLYTYHAPLGQLQQVSGGLGQQSITYTAGGRLSLEQWSLAGATYTQHYLGSLRGRSLSFTGPYEAPERYEYDPLGRLSAIRHGEGSGQAVVTFAYDALGQPALIHAWAANGRPTQEQTITHDPFGRELSRVWRCRGAGEQQDSVLAMDLAWDGRDRVVSRALSRDGQPISVETYQYDRLGRLALVEAAGPMAPSDPRTGKRIARQAFTLTVMDSPAQVQTTYADGSVNTMTYHYDPAVPDLPLGISHVGVEDTRIDLEWDANGRLVNETRDGILYRTLEWDSLGRLSQVVRAGVPVQWHYGPQGQVAAYTDSSGTDRRHYRGEAIVARREPDGAITHWVRDEHRVFAETRLAGAVRSVLLTGADGQGSVRVEVDDSSRAVGYTAYGEEDGTARAWTGFAGQVRDRDQGWYHPGGYRPYDPALGIFLAPDALSPFGSGGLSRYAYCGGDPVNNIDPTGQSFWKWLGMGLMAVVGAALALTGVGALAGAAMVAGGAAAVAGGALSMTATLVMGAAATVAGTLIGLAPVVGLAMEVVSSTTGVAGAVLEAAGDEQAANILGWVALGTGVAGVVTGLGPEVAKAAYKGARFVGRWQRRLEFVLTGKGGYDYDVRLLSTDVRDGVEYHYVYTNNYRGKGQEALLIHGDENGRMLVGGKILINGRGEYEGAIEAPVLADAAGVSRYLASAHGVSLAQGKGPIHLISCYAQRGAAQALATETGRPVIAYSEGPLSFRGIQMLEDIEKPAFDFIAKDDSNLRLFVRAALNWRLQPSGKTYMP